MPKLPRVSGTETVRVLERLGFSVARHKVVTLFFAVALPVALFQITVN